MESADKLFERAKRLKPEELSELVARLDEYLLSSASNESSERRDRMDVAWRFRERATPTGPMFHLTKDTIWPRFIAQKQR